MMRRCAQNFLLCAYHATLGDSDHRSRSLDGGSRSGLVVAAEGKRGLLCRFFIDGFTGLKLFRRGFIHFRAFCGLVSSRDPVVVIGAGFCLGVKHAGIAGGHIDGHALVVAGGALTARRPVAALTACSMAEARSALACSACCCNRSDSMRWSMMPWTASRMDLMLVVLFNHLSCMGIAKAWTSSFLTASSSAMAA